LKLPKKNNPHTVRYLLDFLSVFGYLDLRNSSVRMPDGIQTFWHYDYRLKGRKNEWSDCLPDLGELLLLLAEDVQKTINEPPSERHYSIGGVAMERANEQ
jgi:hypothetical protein